MPPRLLAELARSTRWALQAHTPYLMARYAERAEAASDEASAVLSLALLSAAVYQQVVSAQREPGTHHVH